MVATAPKVKPPRPRPGHPGPSSPVRWMFGPLLVLVGLGLLFWPPLGLGADDSASLWAPLFLAGAALWQLGAGLNLRRRRLNRALRFLAGAGALNLIGLLAILAHLGRPRNLIFFFLSPNWHSPVFWDALFFSLNLGLVWGTAWFLAGRPEMENHPRRLDGGALVFILSGAGLALYIASLTGGLAPGHLPGPFGWVLLLLLLFLSLAVFFPCWKLLQQRRPAPF